MRRPLPIAIARTPGRSSPWPSPPLPSRPPNDRIDLPAGWPAEGMTSDGTTLYAGSLADGAIWQGDAVTGEGERAR